jgi:acetamidase/formamidase
MARTTVDYEDGHVYEFGPEMEAVYTAAAGESLTVETDDAWTTLASAETLETAVKRANRDALTLLEREQGLDRTGAYLLSRGCHRTVLIPAVRLFDERSVQWV